MTEAAESKIPLEFIELSNGYKAGDAEVNRTWLAGALLLVLALGADPEKSSLPLAGLDHVTLFCVLSIVSAMVNFRLCGSMLGMYKYQKMFHNYLDDINAKETYISTSVSLEDLAHRLRRGSYNRLFPNLLAFAEGAREPTMDRVKSIFDLFFLTIPMAGLVIAFFKGVVVANPTTDDDPSNHSLIWAAAPFVALQLVFFIATAAVVLNSRSDFAKHFDL